MIFKTEAWPEGRNWPDEIVLDVGSSMPTDVYGCDRSGEAEGVRYVRKDVAGDGRREIRRLRRALWQITRSKWEHSDYLAACKCGRCIARRALKGKG